MTGMTLTQRLDSGESIDESDLLAATDTELVDVIRNTSYPVSLRDAAHAALVEVTYEHLKLVDRVRPGRTPWQTLRRRAILVTASTLGEAVSVGGSPELDEPARVRIVWTDPVTRRTRRYGTPLVSKVYGPDGQLERAQDYVARSYAGRDDVDEAVASVRVENLDGSAHAPELEAEAAGLERPSSGGSPELDENRTETFLVTERDVAGTRLADYKVERIFRDGLVVSETVRDEHGIAVAPLKARELIAGIPGDETPAEELGRLRRELSEHDHETPEHAAILDRIAVLTREAAVERRASRLADDPRFVTLEHESDEELEATIRRAELELERRRRPDIAELREELDGIETGLAIARSEEELRGLARLALGARDRVYGTPGVGSELHRRVDDVLARARTMLMTVTT